MTDESFFRADFLETPASEVARRLDEDGFWVCEGALRRSVIETIERELALNVAVNVNDVGPVRYHLQSYFTYGLARSKTYFDLVVHPHIRDIARAAVGPQFRLKCQRYVVNETGFELPWHTDNKTSTGIRTEVRGIGVVVYLRDTYEGELMVVRGSHRITPKLPRTDWMEEDIAREHGANIVTLSYRAGTVLLFDSMTMHRTRKITIPGYKRPSIFLQIDADLQHSEKIIVDTAFPDPHDEDQLRYLGLGLPSGYPIMPPSDLTTLDDVDLARIAGRSALQLAKRTARAPAKKAWNELRRLRRRFLP